MCASMCIPNGIKALKESMEPDKSPLLVVDRISL